MTNFRRSTTRAATAALAMAVCLAALPACRREKPNANADLQKSQRELMDDMDKIAAQIEAEEKAQKEKTAPTAPPTAPPDAPPPSEQKAPTPKPSPTPPGGG